jgi:hypothetical protein
MNRTAFAASLTDAELTDEITMYEVEQVEHRNDADWSGYNMLHALLAEQEIRRARAANPIPGQGYLDMYERDLAAAQAAAAAATLPLPADFDTWLWSLPETADSAALADMQRYGWEDGRPVEYQTV